MLSSPSTPVIPEIITGLVNDLLNLEKECVLVLEDYHVIEQAEIHDSLNFLLDHLPSGADAGDYDRSDPPLNLARRRRGAGELLEIRATDLRFSSEEVATFLNQVMLLDLTPDDIAALRQGAPKVGLRDCKWWRSPCRMSWTGTASFRRSAEMIAILLII